MRMPAEIESRMPLTTFAVYELPLYVFRSPRPIAMAIGVVSPYAAQRNQGSHENEVGIGIAERRAPMALERLVEDNDRVERRELVAGRAKRKADNDRVEDDAELEDEKRGYLLPERALNLVGRLLVRDPVARVI
jgi:hypothetical protein